jgi:hypothetical protein
MSDNWQYVCDYKGTEFVRCDELYDTEEEARRNLDEGQVVYKVWRHTPEEIWSLFSLEPGHLLEQADENLYDEFMILDNPLEDYVTGLEQAITAAMIEAKKVFLERITQKHIGIFEIRNLS